MDGSSPEAPMVVDHDDPDAIAKVAAAHALDALTANETREVRDHLPGCVKRREEVARMREAAGVLAYAVEPIQSPDDLRGALVERSRKEADQGPGIHLLPEPEKPYLPSIVAGNIVIVILRLVGVIKPAGPFAEQQLTDIPLATAPR